MNHRAQAYARRAEPAAGAPPLRLVKTEAQPTAATTLIVPAENLQPTAAPQPSGMLHALWQLLFGPPEIDVRGARSDFGVFRALYEIGSDHLPSSGTWPTR